MIEFHIRKATLFDLPDIQELNLKLFQREKEKFDTYLSLEWSKGISGTSFFKRRISDSNGIVLLAMVDYKVVGYLCGIAYPQVPTYRIANTSALENMLVLNEYRRKGIGQALVDEFLKELKNRNIKQVRVDVYTKNQDAIKFYKRNGFKDYLVILESAVD